MLSMCWESLYLCGRMFPRDREKAVEYLTASAEQKEICMPVFTEHLDAYQDQVLISGSLTRTASSSGKLFCEEATETNGNEADIR